MRMRKEYYENGSFKPFGIVIEREQEQKLFFNMMVGVLKVVKNNTKECIFARELYDIITKDNKR